MSENEQKPEPITDGLPQKRQIEGGKRLLDRKIMRNRWALLFERLWLKAWPLFALLLVFLTIGLLGGWQQMPPLLHRFFIGWGLLACVTCFVFICRVPFPTKEEGLARLDRLGTLPHRPASSFDDHLPKEASVETKNIWQAYRRSLVRKIEALKVKGPRPQSEKFDPFALRVILPLLFITALFAGRGHLGAAAQSAFQFAPLKQVIPVKMNAWVTPPSYTAKPPILLAEKEFGAGVEALEAMAVTTPFKDIPQGSKVSIRLNGTKGSALGDLTVSFQKQNEELETKLISQEEKNTQKPQKEITHVPQVDKENSASPRAKTYQFTLNEGGTMKLARDGKVLAQWAFAIRPDTIPSIGLIEMPKRAKSGALTLNYYVDDDYGVQTAIAGLIAKSTEGDLAKLKAINPLGQRFNRHQKAMLAPKEPADTDLTQPLAGPIQFPLDLLSGKTEGTRREGQTIQNLVSHPWAGQEVQLLLMAKDDFGHRGFSPLLTFLLPARAFQDPLAKEIITVRSQLIAAPAFKKRVRAHIRAIQQVMEARKMEPRVYLGLSSAYHQLGIFKRRSQLNQTVDLLWKLALRIEDGDLSDAERRLRDAREALEQALKDGATDKEIAKAMKELREAMKDYLKAMAKAQKKQDQNQAQQNSNPNSKTLNSEDIKRMLDQIEQAMKSGSKEAAKQMLSQLQQMLENVQKPNQNQAGDQDGQQDQSMGKLGEMMQDQQELMEETFQERRRKNNPQAQGREAQQGQQGERAQGQEPQQGEKGDEGQRGKEGQGERRGENGQQGQDGEGGQRGQRGKNAQQGQNGQEGGRGENGREGQARQGQNGQPRNGNQGQKGQRRAQTGQRGQSGQLGMGRNGSLSQRQKALSNQLGQMLQEMERGGMKVPDGLRGAQKSMNQAERSLRRNQHPFAMRQQGRALEQLRKGMQQLQKQQGQQQQNARGRPGGQRDPFGRRSGPNGGFNEGRVKIPGAEDMKRAGEIMQELRDKLSNPQRPTYERDYFERLLKRF